MIATVKHRQLGAKLLLCDFITTLINQQPLSGLTSGLLKKLFTEIHMHREQ